MQDKKNNNWKPLFFTQGWLYKWLPVIRRQTSERNSFISPCTSRGAVTATTATSTSTGTPRFSVVPTHYSSRHYHYLDTWESRFVVCWIDVIIYSEACTIRTGQMSFQPKSDLNKLYSTSKNQEPSKKSASRKEWRRGGKTWRVSTLVSDYKNTIF
jgi:hypothetical protein